MAQVPSRKKITKNGVVYVSSVDRTKYTIRELSRGALRDIGQYLVTQVRNESRRRAHSSRTLIRSRFYGKRGAISYWVRKIETDLQVGFVHDTWYSALQERGENGQPGKHLLETAVQKNIPEIRLIEGHYLSAIEDENRALGLIDDKEMEPKDGE